MTPNQVQLVKRSFEAAAIRPDRLAGFFFAELFARDAVLWRRFRAGAGTRDAALFDGMAAIVGSIDRIHPIVPVLEWLAFQGTRHGIGEVEYDAVGEALVAALAAMFGDAFTAEHRAAWTAAAHAVARVMVRALAAEPLAA
jgi:hemoglobin-like flavoprotein